MNFIKRMPLRGPIGSILIIILLLTTIGVSIYSNNEYAKLEAINGSLNATINEQTSKIANIEDEKEKLNIRISELIEENERLKKKADQTVKNSTSTQQSTTTKTVATSTGGKNLGQFRISAYCSCKKCCGKWAGGKTASGTTPTAGRTIAVDPKVIPLGSKVIIDGHTYVAEDTGGAIKGNRIDMYFSSHSEALSWGIKYKNATLIS